jgi:uncharacterized repeat protein (TIGR01451 family)
VVDAGPGTTTCGTDPTTGVFGLKFDTGLNQGETRQFYITMSGEWPTGEIQAAVKAGQFEYYCTILGPACVPDIDVEKTALTTTFGAVGNVIEYAIVVTNTGFFDLTNVVVTDDLTGDVFNIASLPIGASQTLSTFYSVVEGDFCNNDCMPMVYNEVTATGYYGSEMASDTDDETVYGVYPGFGPIAGTSDEVACYADIEMPALPEVFDFCGIAITNITGPVVSTVPDCYGEITYTWTYEDCWGNTQDYVHTVTILPPTVEIPADGGETVACPSLVIAPAAPALEDNCGRSLTFIGVSDPDIVECYGDVTFTYTWEDCAGEEYTWDYVFTVLAPVVEIPANGAETVACPSLVIAPAAPVLFDNCGRELEFIGVSDPDIVECYGDVTFTYTWEDCAGEEYTWDFVFTVLAPVVEIPANGAETVACPSLVIAPAAPVLFDNCGRELEFIGVSDPDIVECYGDVTFTYTWEDCAGEEYTWDFVFTVLAPVVEIPANGAETVACPSLVMAPAAPVLFDNCGRELEFIGVSDPDIVECYGDVTFTYTWEDCAGEEYTWDFVFTVLAPVVEIPANGAETVACPSLVMAPAAPVLFDNCGRELEFIGVSDPDIVECYGDVTFTYTWEDCAGEEYTWDFVFTVLAPVVEIPANGAETVACPSLVIAPAAPVLFDNCGRELEFIGVSDPDIVECYGDVTFTYTWEDCAGEEYTWDFVFTVLAPVVEIPANGAETVACPSLVIAPAAPVLFDNCGRELEFIGRTSPETDVCYGDVTFTYTWEDCAGEEYTWDFVFTVLAPVVEIPANGAETVACPSLVIAPAAPVLFDNCGRELEFIGVSDPDIVECYGDVTFTYTWEDCAGEEYTWDFVFTVLAPVVEIPANGAETVACPSLVIAPAAPVLYDNCGRELEFIGVSDPDIVECYGDVTFTYTWEDCAGEEYTWDFVFTVLAPVVEIPANGAETVACPSLVIAPAAPVLYDNCGRELEFIGVSDPDIVECYGDVTFTYTWEDCAGEEYTWDFVFTVLAPVVEIPANGAETVACPSLVIAPAAPVLFDNCGRELEFIGVSDPDIVECYGDVTFTYTWEDCAGEEYTWDFVFTVLAPEVEIPANGAETVACPSLVIAPAAPVLFDNCGRELEFIGVSDPDIVECYGDVTFTYTWEDCAGEEYTWDFVFTVLAPVVEIPANGAETVACPSLVIAPAAPVLFDNCGRELEFIGVSDPDIVECYGDVTFTYTWEDCAGEEYTWDFVFTVLAPVVEIPANGAETVACPSLVIAPAAPVLFDNCGRELEFIGVSDPDIVECYGDVTFTYTWEDCAGEEYTWDFVFTVLAPVVEIPANGAETVACPSLVIAPAAPVLFDNCGRELEFIGVSDPDIVECYGDVTFTYTWEDCAGEEYTWDFVFTVLAPVVEIPANGAETVACPSLVIAPAAPVLFDNCGRELEFIGVSDPDIVECYGDVTFTYTWEDCAGEEYTWDFVFTVLAPVVEIPANGAETVACPSLVMLPQLPFYLTTADVNSNSLAFLILISWSATAT